MMQETLAPQVELETAPPQPGSGGGFVRHAISGNYFYFLSAALMLLGCKLLIRSTPFDAAIFTRTLKGLLILQGYEALVIVTALAIVRRFRTLDDAFSLLLIELLLLLDPTFFSNSFFTMLRNERTMLNTWGVLVNVSCCALVPLKLWVLERGLRLRFSPWAWGAFLFAAVYAYLGEGPLCRRTPLPGFSDTAYHYLLSWGPLAFACLLPALRDAVSVAAGGAAGHLSEGRRTALGWLLLVFPLGVICAHFIEVARVHDLFYYPFEFSPAALALAVLVMRQANREKANRPALLLVCDACVAVALALALMRRTELESRAIMGYATRPLPDFAAAHLPLLLIGAGAAAVYGAFYRRFGYRPALWRIPLLALAGCGALLVKFGIVQAVASALWHGGHRLWSATLHYGGLGLGWAVHGVKALLAWPLHALRAVARWTPEIIQAGLLVLLLRDHARREPRLSADGRYLLAGLLVGFGLVHLGLTGSLWAVAVCAAELALLLGLGIWSLQRGYLALAGAQLVMIFLVSLNTNPRFARDVDLVLGDCSDWLGRHPGVVLGVLWAGLLALALRFRIALTWGALGLLTIWLVSGWLPRGREHWIPEMIQAVFILGIAMDHRFNPSPSRPARYLAALLVIMIAQARYLVDARAPQLSSALVIVGESLLLLASAFLLRHPGYLVLGIGQLVGFVWLGWDSFRIATDVSPAALIIGAALALFGAGILVTFNKARLLHWAALAQAALRSVDPLAPIEPPEAEGDGEVLRQWCRQYDERQEQTPEAAEAAVASPAPDPMGPATAEKEPPPEAAPEAPARLEPQAALRASEPAPPPEPEAPASDPAFEHLRATLEVLLATEPPLVLALPPDLRPEVRERIKAGAMLAPPDGKAVYLVKGAPDGQASREWNVIPAWICYPVPEDLGD